jgi:hypothetical protein
LSQPTRIADNWLRRLLGLLLRPAATADAAQGR